MHCIFCKQDSSSSKSIEHIIPESLGNITHILPKGVVCDKCNNYFAREVEKPFLESADFLTLRFQESIPNKKGFVPSVNGFTFRGTQVKVHNPFPGIPLLTRNNIILTIDASTADAPEVLRCGKIFTRAFVDDMIPQSTTIISRFVAKVAFESLAQRFNKIDGGLDYITNESAYDPIRNFVRLGNVDSWPCNIRRIYDMDSVWQDDMGMEHQIVHESDFLLIPVDKNADINHDNSVSVYPYFILVLFGLEFTIYLGCPDADGLDPYLMWLQEHRNASPLHYGKNVSV